MKAAFSNPIVVFSTALLLATIVTSCRPVRVGDRSLAASVPPRENDAAVCAYSTSAHGARHILCGQCHGGGEHPDPETPVMDGTCAGCHTPEFQEQLASTHFEERVPVDLGDWLGREDSADAASQFFARADDVTRFVGQRDAGGAGGLLCVGCHYDGHAFGLAALRRAGACETCHAGLNDHFADEESEGGNRCLDCHVHAGRTVTGQVVNSHHFAK
jgi:hypothetical protein